jgi:predicted NAD/FAD-binding protein
MRIAIVGTGISGMTAAYHLQAEHELTVFEANGYIGGHTNTVDVELDGRSWAVDTGFIVFNDWTYPNFIALMNELGVASQPSDMSFSVHCDRTGLEYCGSSLDQLFAQRRNLLSPGFYGMIADIMRFNKESLDLLDTDDDSLSLGEYLEQGGYRQRFIEHYIIPMGAAIWSSSPASMYRFPARYFVEFFSNHGMLNIKNRPTWRVIKGGSRAYVDKLVAGFADRIHLNTPVEAVRRTDTGVTVHAGGTSAGFDAVLMACHSDQALRLLEDPDEKELGILGAIPYQPNEAVLHTDTRLLPDRRKAWSAWNYHIPASDTGSVALTYDMNILQSLDAPREFCVTLNHDDLIDESKILRRIAYEHPVYTPRGIAAQRRLGDINGSRRTFFAGAYWGFGFHEDGVKSGLAAVDAVRRWQHEGGNERDEQLPLRRAG